jgi:hypothetical protein
MDHKAVASPGHHDIPETRSRTRPHTDGVAGADEGLHAISLDGHTGDTA